MSHKKFGPDRFSRFDVYWIQTDKQTNRQAKFIYRYTGYRGIFQHKLTKGLFTMNIDPYIIRKFKEKLTNIHQNYVFFVYGMQILLKIYILLICNFYFFLDIWQMPHMTHIWHFKKFLKKIHQKYDFWHKGFLPWILTHIF